MEQSEPLANTIIITRQCKPCGGTGVLNTWAWPRECGPECAEKLRPVVSSDYWLCDAHSEIPTRNIPVLWTEQQRQITLSMLKEVTRGDQMERRQG